MSKSNHQKLAEYVKGVHSDLRKKINFDSQNLEDVWREHCENETTLKQYADSMYKLATEHWVSRPESRIEWSRAAILSYFVDGGLHKCLEKDRRRKLKMEALSKEKTSCDQIKQHTPLVPDGQQADSSDRRTDALDGFPLHRRLYILDVGSCYNPFSDFDDFVTVGIDLYPGNEKVFRCDFTNVEIDEESSGKDFVQSLPDDKSSPLLSLPAKSFDVVIFSLLLEYLPSPSQRWKCCKKAFQLLTLHGLLIIITPDSHKQHRNAKMIKDWRTAIESLGFIRWKYEKLEHIHCMAFRKVSETMMHFDEIKSVEKMFIHQDFNSENVSEDCRLYTEDDEEDFKECLHELPFCIDDQEELK